MKYIILLIFLFPLISLAQKTDSSFRAKSFLVKEDVYSKEQGTTGLIFYLEYYYKKENSTSITTIPSLLLKKEGTIVYQHKKTLLPLRSNQWNSIQVFIPYRKIDLPKGFHNDVVLEFEIPNITAMQKSVRYTQPTRYAIEINLKGGNIKKKLKAYDKSTNPKDWAPDSYFTFSTSKNSTPIYTSNPNYNDYYLKPEKVTFHILEGEQLVWNFYEKDAASSQLLGTYNGLNAKGDFKDNILGIMFGDIANLEFDYIQKELAYQALTVYIDSTSVYQNKKGVKIAIQYDLSNAYVGQDAIPRIQLHTKDKQTTPLNYAFPYDVNTPPTNEYFKLQRKGKLHYFIPFYAWEETSSEIAFSLETREGEILESAKYIIRKPISFGKFVHEADFAVEQEYTYRGAKGIRLSINYHVPKIKQIGDLLVNLTSNRTLPEFIYLMSDEDNTVTRVREFPAKIDNPSPKNKLHLFIPYHYIDKHQFNIQLSFDTKKTVQVLHKTTEIIERKADGFDADFELAKAGPGFLMDNYGQVLNIKAKIPQFFSKKSKLNFKVKRNNQNFDQYIVSQKNSSNQNGAYIITSDTLSFHIGIPHRLIKKDDVIEVIAYLTDLEDRMMSQKIIWNWTAQKELWNKEIVVNLNSLKFDKKILKDTTNDSNFPWNLAIDVGGKNQKNIPLPKVFRARNKKEFRQKIFVNREDNIEIYFYNTITKRKIRIAKGDLSKMAQFDYKYSIENHSVIKKAKIFIESDDTPSNNL